MCQSNYVFVCPDLSIYPFLTIVVWYGIYLCTISLTPRRVNRFYVWGTEYFYYLHVYVYVWYLERGGL